MAGIRKNYNWYVNQGLTPPKGMKPKATGYERRTYNWYVQRGLKPPAGLSIPKAIKSHTVTLPTMIPAAVSTETEAEIDSRIKIRFNVLEALVGDVINGNIQALIVSGPPGLGKSYTIEQALKDENANCRITKGFTRATGLYKLLYEYREEGSILVFDDADSVFEDVVALNLLKTALDTTEERVISWLSENSFEDADGEEIPSSFSFEGSIIFITNLDFDGLIQRQNKISKHLEALISRCHYVDLMMKSTKDFIVRIKQVVKETKMLAHLSKTEVQDVVKFIEDNQSKLREISLRTALKVATLRKSNTNWNDVAKITCCKV